MLHFIVPALLDPWPDASLAPPRLPALERLIARGDCAPGADGMDTALFERFGIPPAARQGAPHCWLGLTGKRPGGWMLHAHPVHYRADRDRLLLFPVEEEILTGEMAARCLDRFNDHFAGEGLELRAARPDQWFLFSNRPVEATFTPLHEAQGRGLHDCMPQGKEAAWWRSVLNETQMLFHPLELAINGLWFDGAGRLPEPMGRAPVLARDETDCLALGLARNAAGRDTDVELVLCRHLEKARQRADATAWLMALERLEARVAEAMEAGTELLLEPCNGTRWHWVPAMKRRFWRRARPLHPTTA
ncbi:MAG TPA: hypothetical protein ENJ98_05585 [Thiolapillus brandeum]|uniref:Phosphoglycerate mutase n=1 Tax=Thiolapillus brandeum TaxID=1076588 RepID=A0A7C5IZ37_9GAMM|nr:hypothetical protein [Thiolapillus brandeum]